MTPEQLFHFDLKGWLVVPSVLSRAEVAACRKHVEDARATPSPLPEIERNTYAGPCGELLDHPVVVDVLRELVAPDLVRPEWVSPENRDFAADRAKPSLAYSFRCDNSF